MTTGPHQRDVIWDGEVAFKDNGKVLGIKAKFVVDLGVEGTTRGTGASSILSACHSVPNAYKLKGYAVDAYGVVTNKSFYCAYRGYGKDKGIKFMERIMTAVARELNLSPEEIRLRNFIQPNEFPYRQISGFVYDSGNYQLVLRKALEISEIEKWRNKRGSIEGNKCLGVGLAFTIEPAGAATSWSTYTAITTGRVKINPDGKVEVYSDQTELGQGSATVSAQVVADILGIISQTSSYIIILRK